jgi:hypothetical protein
MVGGPGLDILDISVDVTGTRRRSQIMILEGYIGLEISKLRVDEFQREVAQSKERWSARQSAGRASLRQRLGDAMIRTGGRQAGVVVDPCLNAHQEIHPARG